MRPGDGSLAEQCAVATADLVPIDGELSDAAAAAIGTSGIAAWMALTWRARLQPGERVVVLGASGIVGQVALAAARHLGAAQRGRGRPVGGGGRRGPGRPAPHGSSRWPTSPTGQPSPSG